jgi:hypothetical protein
VDAGRGAGEEDAGVDAWEGGKERRSNTALLCELLKKPLREGRKKFLATSAAFQEWVWESLDCWQAGSAVGSALMRQSIRRLIALPASPRVRKAHPMDGLVTWTEDVGRTGKLASGFQYRALSIWRRVTRGMTQDMRSHSKSYTVDHIERVVDWFRKNSVIVLAGQTAEAVKTAYKAAFGCMNPCCGNPFASQLEVDHVNPEMKTIVFKDLIKKRGPGKYYVNAAYVVREQTQVLCVLKEQTEGFARAVPLARCPLAKLHYHPECLESYLACIN